jgi:hypothetical protein
MFQERYARFRHMLLAQQTLLTMAHLGPDAFPEIGGEVVQATAFVMAIRCIPEFKPVFFALYDGDSDSKAAALREQRGRIDDICFNDFQSMPEAAFLYWASWRTRELFRSGHALGSIVSTREGMATADNDRFLRLFWEVSTRSVCRDAINQESATRGARRWFPYVKGGEFRKWYGNNEWLVNWYRDGEEVRSLTDPQTGRVRSHNYNGEYAFRLGLSWSGISSNAIAARFVPAGFMFDAKGPMAFAATADLCVAALGLINSTVGFHFMRLVAPSLDFKLGHIEGIPFVDTCLSDEAFRATAQQCISLSRSDWNEQEISPDYRVCSLVTAAVDNVSTAWNATNAARGESRLALKTCEERNNRWLIALYGLQDELSPEVPDDQITLYRPDREEDIKRLLSYAVGCMMGRYSLDKEGLIYASSGNEGFDPSQYRQFPADEDGIVPVTEAAWFDDDAANRFERFVKTVWPANTLDENLTFVAESLGAKKSETPRETIRRYFAGDFYKHHLQTYKNRPIYWRFSSGKQGAFEALVYLHRYNEGTLSRMRTEYVVPLLGKINGRQGMLADVIAKATSTKQRKDAEKEKDKLVKQLAELQAFDDKLRHYADQRITLDLDDGVRVNYGKFGDLLADVKKVCGKAEDE